MICAKTLLLSAALAALGTTGLAQQSCFARDYTSAHLANNPAQTVRSLAIRFEGPATDKTTTGEWGDVTAYFADTPIKFIQTLYCSSYDGAHYCGVECDGGRAEISWKNRDTILLKTQGFIVSGGCDGEETETRFVQDRNAKLTTFRLNRTTMDACPPLDQ